MPSEHTVAESAGKIATPLSHAIPILEPGARTGKSANDPSAGIGIGTQGDPMFSLQAGKQHGVCCFQSKDSGESCEDIAPTLRALNHSESHANAGGQLAVAFKPSHFTRDKDGAPAETAPPLSADADKGDQDTVVAYRTSGNCGVMEQGDKSACLNTATDPNQNIVAFQPRIARNGRGDMGEIVNALNAESGQTGKGDSAPCVAFGLRAANTSSNGWGVQEEKAHTLDGASPHRDAMRTAVRRLTPRECERLQGYPDDYTKIPKQNGKYWDDGPRYRALGNSFAVPVVRWIGQRILTVEELTK